jgi:hypothetical protein
MGLDTGEAELGVRRGVDHAQPAAAALRAHVVDAQAQPRLDRGKPLVQDLDPILQHLDLLGEEPNRANIRFARKLGR